MVRIRQLQQTRSAGVGSAGVVPPAEGSYVRRRAKYQAASAYPFSVFHPSQTERNLHNAVGTCPSIWREARPDRISSRYVRERHTGRWSARIGADPSNKTLSMKYTRRIGLKIADFQNWSFAQGLTLEAATYQDILQYQQDIRAGAWGTKRRKLSPDWANDKADEACSFLLWMAKRGLRPAFEVTTKLVVQRSRRSNKIEKAIVRTGKETGRRESTELLVLPDWPKVDAWLAELRVRRGYSKTLASRTVVELATRRAETCGILKDQWPSRTAIDQGMARGHKTVSILITEEVKFSKDRSIDFDIAFASLVRHWIDTQWQKLAEIYQRRTGLQTTRLFLSDSPGHEGTPIQPETLYQCFKLRAKGGPTLWYPHHGRHFSICDGLIAGLRRDAAVAQRPISQMPSEWVLNRTKFWMDMQRRKAGHMSEETTQIYTRWLNTNHILVNVHDDFASFMDGVMGLPDSPPLVVECPVPHNPASLNLDG